MKKVLKYLFLGLALVVGASAAANASPVTPAHSASPLTPWHHDPLQQAPEVDPALAISGLSLLGGTLTVLRARRRK